jgi:dUTP pyrophosphatase
MSEEPKQPNFNEMTYPSEADNLITVNLNEMQGSYRYSQNVHILMDEGCEDLIPSKAHDDDAGYDLRSKEDITLAPMSVTLVHTGVHICMHPKIDRSMGLDIVQYHMLADVRSRSGLALKQGLFVLNSPGTIDQSYKGEICVIMFNTKQEPYQIKRGDRIAQLVFLYQPITHLISVDKEEFESLDTDSDRGSGGFGSTGR